MKAYNFKKYFYAEVKKMREKLHTGKLYLPNDGSIMTEQTACLELLYEFNQTRPREQVKRQALLQKMFGKIGPNCYLEPPFHANFGGKHCYFGDHIYANFNLTVVDDTHIYVGDHTMFGPNVTLATAGHPILPELREKGTNIIKRSTSAKIVGSGQVSSSCLAFRSVITR